VYDGCILPVQYYVCIYGISYTSLLSVIYAVYRGYAWIAIVPGSVFFTSILYWQRPDYSWRRYVDIVVVHVGLLYQCCIAYDAEMRDIYYITVVMCMIMYMLGIHYYQQKNLLISTFCYMCVHVIGNIGNIILYSGKLF
jgi:hypothetical protein